ncbi:T9SS type A sorting domain-containing protein [Aestuariivivens sediminis]|uniref:T9SS type A sorting domain-containing protein n=1 Tax=Aestuariivivens sediminis TaxID=2913557 RepID=UPI001F5A5FB3|nr:T9SS type A sorting domain-containing protein [Aestuariivivens sediminis]
MKRLLLFTFLSIFTIHVNAQLFSAKKTINSNTGNLPSVIDSGKIDSDNFVDIVIGTTYGSTIEWYKNNGDGTFTMQTLVTSSLTGVLGLDLADMDGDTDLDIVASAYFAAKVVWYENDGNGNFGTEHVIATGISEAGAVKVGRIDNNLTNDVVVASGAAGQVIWLSNTGSGSFTSAQVVGSDGDTPRSIDIGDFNGDGTTDVVVGFFTTRNVELYENQGGSSPSFVRNASGSISSGSSNINEVSFGDVDNDTYLDIVKVNKNGSASWYKKETNGSFTEHILSSSYSNPATALVADYDDDSTNDIVVGYAGSGMDAMTWYDSSSPEALIDNTQDDINQITINDFDNDGDLDIASISQQQNDLNWFENLTYSASLSTSEAKLNTVSVYPNPTRDLLKFKASTLPESFEVSVYNIIGKNVLTEKLYASNAQLDVSKLNQGVYLLSIKDLNTSLKFIKH